MRRLLTRRRRMIGLYVFCSVVVALLLFTGLRRHIELERALFSTLAVKLKALPAAVQDPKHEAGYLSSFDRHPFTTTMECFGETATERVCRARNMCYSPNSDKFFAVIKDGYGLKKRWHKPFESRLLDTVTVNDHNVFYFEFEEDPVFARQMLEESGMKFRRVERQTFAFSRFVFNNIMHNIHDDFIGQYLLHKKFGKGGQVNADNYIFFLDQSIEMPHDHLFATLTRHPFLYRQDFKTKPKMEVICFDDMIIGNSKEGTWFDYGFYAEPQGPISYKPLDGFKVREAAAYLLNYYNIPLWNQKQLEQVKKKVAKRNKSSKRLVASNYYISIFSRTKDRLILNEKDLCEHLEARFGLPVRLIQLENMKFNEIIQVMSRTLIGIGLHGSALIFAMFMPQNSVLLEMFPYTVPGENYCPYRTLSWLTGVDITYRMWKNTQASMNFAQFGQRRTFSGLTAEELLNLLTLKTVPPHTCCDNLAWNYKIYQDTVVDIPQVTKLLTEAIKEKRDVKAIKEKLEMSRHRVSSVAYDVHKQDRFIGNEVAPLRLMIVQWDNPWAGKGISKAPSQYGVWIEEMVDEVIVRDASLYLHTCLAGSDVHFWIRPYYLDGNVHVPGAPFSQKFVIKCE